MLPITSKAKKTVVVAMHQLQYLFQMDHIVMVKKGKIHMQGSYKSLMGVPEFAELIASHVSNGDDEDVDDDPIPAFPLTVNTSRPSSIAHDIRVPSTPTDTFSSFRSWRDLTKAQSSSLLERSQASVLRGAAPGQHDLASVIEQNELSVYSTQDISDINALNDDGKPQISDGKKRR